MGLNFEASNSSEASSFLYSLCTLITQYKLQNWYQWFIVSITLLIPQTSICTVVSDIHHCLKLIKLRYGSNDSKFNLFLYSLRTYTAQSFKNIHQPLKHLSWNRGYIYTNSAHTKLKMAILAIKISLPNSWKKKSFTIYLMVYIIRLFHLFHICPKPACSVPSFDLVYLQLSDHDKVKEIHIHYRHVIQATQIDLQNM